VKIQRKSDDHPAFGRLFLRRKLPLDSGLLDAEALAFGIALTGAARLGAHHGKIASLTGGCVHAGFRHRTVRSWITCFWDVASATEQGHTFMTAENAGRSMGVPGCDPAELVVFNHSGRGTLE
jgi:hypothetical protein